MARPALPDAEDEPDPAESSVESRARLVDASAHGQRLDKVLVALAAEFSRSHLQGLIARGHVRVDGAVADSASRKLRAGQHVVVELVPTAQCLAFKPETIALTIVYEDSHLLVLDKPVGLVVHPAAGNWSGTLLNGLLAHHEAAAQLPRAGIVHRLDKDTSGLLVVAKSLPAMTGLTRAIAAREVRRSYLALAQGEVAWRQRRIDAPIGRDPGSRIRMAVVAGGKAALTDVERLGVGAGASRLRCRLHSGRTHQIRVHMAFCGHPLVADSLYGGKANLGLTRQALHAAELAFEHPVSKRVLQFQSALPADLEAAWRISEAGCEAG
jgi:23S rRNA pseudouridine1911/1915/1917 synthase